MLFLGWLGMQCSQAVLGQNGTAHKRAAPERWARRRARSEERGRSASGVVVEGGGGEVEERRASSAGPSSLAPLAIPDKSSQCNARKRFWARAELHTSEPRPKGGRGTRPGTRNKGPRRPHPPTKKVCNLQRHRHCERFRARCSVHKRGAKRQTNLVYPHGDFMWRQTREVACRLPAMTHDASRQRHAWVKSSPSDATRSVDRRAELPQRQSSKRPQRRRGGRGAPRRLREPSWCAARPSARTRPARTGRAVRGRARTGPQR